MTVQTTRDPVQGRTALYLPTLTQGSTGSAVVELQRLLAQAGFSPGLMDGDFGPKTYAAVVAFQRARGLSADGVVDGDTWAALKAPAPPLARGLRARILAEAAWCVANEPSIHYKQERPIDGTGQRRKLPLVTDCSGFVTLCYEWAGAEDPNGLGFNGQGSTDTLLAHMKDIPQSQVRPGDLVLWASGRDGKHVALVIEPGEDPLLVSHGLEAGPYHVRFSVSHRSHAGQDVHWLRLPSLGRGGG